MFKMFSNLKGLSCVLFKQPVKGFFIVSLTYEKGLDQINSHLEEHRKFLDDNYKQGNFVASGPKIPRTGGVILSPLKDLGRLQAILAKDPFNIHGVAKYEITEFNPTKYDQRFAACAVDGKDASAPQSKL